MNHALGRARLQGVPTGSRGLQVRAILPVGVIEPHGAHLPLGTDMMAAHWVDALVKAIAAMKADTITAELLAQFHRGSEYPSSPYQASSEHRRHRSPRADRADLEPFVSFHCRDPDGNLPEVSAC